MSRLNVNKTPTITILGAGYVGLTTGAILAQSGYQTYLVEPNQERLDIIRSGKSFFYEKGLDRLIQEGLNKKMLLPTDSYSLSVSQSDIIFSCVGTPDNPDGSSNLDYIFEAAKTTLEYIKRDTIYVQKSTVPVGTGYRLIDIFNQSSFTIDYLSNPEFLREGTAIADSLYPDRTVIGGNNANAINSLIKVYKQIESSRQIITKLTGIDQQSKTCQYITTEINSAELIKVTANAFLAMKISFANSIAILSDRVNADVVEIMDGIGSDLRIGSAFLRAGRGYGGGCFPKDVSGLISSAKEYGIDLALMQSTQAINANMPKYIIDKLKDQLTTLNNKQIIILGLSFKSGTSDTRKSPGIAMANICATNQARVTVFDPVVDKNNLNDLDSRIQIISSISEIPKSPDAIIVATEWPEFCNLTPSQIIALLGKKGLLVDAINAYDPKLLVKHHIQYLGVGRRL
ncbi:UDP-glucose/GDP-mannose dehydrogenase family protein [Candidatus Saccharibacteria bacterium]|nr:UDP-glucose/GDP-mannose dehydrogenase family protein [Candidatus Saccharibacteria bacterium]